MSPEGVKAMLAPPVEEIVTVGAGSGVASSALRELDHAWPCDSGRHPQVARGVKSVAKRECSGSPK